MLGAHPAGTGEKPVWRFALWAPNARTVSLIGEFCRWDRSACPMRREEDGVWVCEVEASAFDTASDPARYTYPDAAEKIKTYKYAVQGSDGAWHDRADPYGFQMEQRPNTASRLCDLDGYAWRDADWMAVRAERDTHALPLNIYEVHLGSWRRADDGRMLTYEEIADALVPYVRDMGYTHVEFLPVMEHPFDGSWGYQVTGYFAATSRYGDPKGLMALIDRFHQAGIGVILDWVPAHFPKDEAGLSRFDGTCLYEHPDPRRGEMPQWGTCLFDMSRAEVRSFLLSGACFWLERFHADGLRVDAVSAMLYLDFGKQPGQWLPESDGGNISRDGVSLLRLINDTVHERFPGALMIAEESTAFEGVTHPVKDGGLGFDYKWNMGWMNDTLAYIREDPIFRKWHHNRLTFGLMYAFSEHFILPYSHDEVVYGKKSMLDKQPGDIWKKFAGLRALYGFQMAHPGKKLLFMGGEFGQFIEWRHDDPLDWFLLRYDMHPQLQACVREMNRLYRETPALWEQDDGWEGFQWVQVDDRDNSIVAFLRTDRRGRSLLCLTNFTPVYRPHYSLGLPLPGTLTEVLNTDRNAWGGSDQHNPAPVHTVDRPYGDFPVTLELAVPPMASVWFAYDKEYPETNPQRASAEQSAEQDISPENDQE